MDYNMSILSYNGCKIWLNFIKYVNFKSYEVLKYK